MSMRYANVDNTLVVVDEKMTIPVDPGNRDWRKILREGQPIDPYVPPVVGPDIRAKREDAVRALLVERARGANVPSAIADYLSVDP